jgi:hypothetical protein
MTPPRFRSQVDLFAEQPGLCVARLPPCAVVVTPPDANRGRLGLPSPQYSKEGPGDARRGHQMRRERRATNENAGTSFGWAFVAACIPRPCAPLRLHRLRPPQAWADAAMSRLVITAGLKLIVVPIDSTWTRRSLASGSRARLPTPAEPERVAPASASRSGPVPRVGAPERRW